MGEDFEKIALFAQWGSAGQIQRHFFPTPLVFLKTIEASHFFCFATSHTTLQIFMKISWSMKKGEGILKPLV